MTVKGIVFLVAVAMTMIAQPCLVAGHPSQNQDLCSCEQNKSSNGWCDPCGMGYVAGVRILSQMLVDALDVHGHPVDVGTLECDLCRDAAAADAVCQRCGWGFVDGAIYGSRLTYYLSLGQRGAKEGSRCDSCRERREGAGWCDSCASGWVGSFQFVEWDVHEATDREYRLLLLAVENLERCETCAVACYFGSSCPHCGVTYVDGRAVEP